MMGARSAAAVVTCSDSAWPGRAGAASGPLARELIEALGLDARSTAVVPDEAGAIRAASRAGLQAWVNSP